MQNHSLLRSTLSSLLVCVGLACMLAPAAAGPAALAQPRASRASGRQRLVQGPAAWPTIASRPQAPVAMPSAAAGGPAVAGAPAPMTVTRVQSPTLDLKLLVLAADGSEPALTTIRQALNYLGTPYTVWIATQHPNALTAAALYSDAHGFYQGVILTTGNLLYSTNGGATWQSALSAPEWQALWSYEAAFGVRQATWYTFPTADYGFGASTPVDTTSSPILATLTTAGRTIFPYINATNPITISNAYAYLAPVADASTTPLLTDNGGHALAAVHTYADGRENLALTFDGNEYLVHSIALSNGIIDWVTRGLHLGETHTYIGAQVDDLFLEDNVWSPSTLCGTDPEQTGITYRTTGADIQKLVAWQSTLQAQPTAQQVKLDMVFNGSGALGPDLPANDTLVPAIKQHISDFKWINHTWDHLLLNDVTYPVATDEITRNNDAAQTLGLSPYSTLNMVTPEISGLFNPEYMRAAHDQGIHYLVSDTSRPVASFVLSNTGTYNALQPSIFMIPRRPDNLFYNVSTPEQWAAEYNCFYSAYWGRDLTYAEILGKESDVLLQYLLKGETYPWMFHQPNLRAYDGTHSLIGDLIDLTLAKYNRLYNLPILSPTMDQLGRHIEERTNYGQAIFGVVKAGLAAGQASFSASFIPGYGITLKSTAAITVPITGLATPGAEHYAGRAISYYPLSAGQSVTLSLKTGLPILPPPPPPPQRKVYLPLSIRG